MSYRMTDIIKTECIAMVMVFLAGVFFPYSGFAGESEPHRHHGVGARLSYAIFSTATISDVDLDMVCDDTVFPEINYTYVLRKHFFLELSASYIKTDVDLEFKDQSGNIGEFTQIPVILTLNYNKKINLTDIFFNAGIGAGYYFNDFDYKKRDGVQDFFGLNMQIDDVDDCLGFIGVLGFEYFINKKYSINLDMKVTFYKPDFHLVYGDGTKDSSGAGINTIMLGVGFKYNF